MTNDSKALVRVSNDRNGYCFWVSDDQGENWTPLDRSRHAERVRVAKSNWAADHPMPDPWLSDLPSGVYQLLDLDQGLTLRRVEQSTRGVEWTVQS